MIKRIKNAVLEALDDMVLFALGVLFIIQPDPPKKDPPK